MNFSVEFSDLQKLKKSLPREPLNGKSIHFAGSNSDFSFHSYVSVS